LSLCWICSSDESPFDISCAGPSSPVAGMHGFHSSGEYCRDGPLCHS
jgi:hypothetical protein